MYTMYFVQERVVRVGYTSDQPFYSLFTLSLKKTSKTKKCPETALQERKYLKDEILIRYI